MDPYDKSIMVIKQDILFGSNYFEGFRLQNEVNYELRILENFEYMVRRDAEKNLEYKQPISYSMIVNPNLKSVFVYQRSSQDPNYPEKRLQGKWSCGVGGHIEKSKDESENPLRTSMLREVNEEVEIGGTSIPRVLGYVNYDFDEVGKCHFGILYIVETDSKIIKPKDPEIENGRLKTIEELEQICLSSDVEEWSKIALDQLKLYLD